MDLLLPRKRGIDSLRRAAKRCRACELCHVGTQTVFGEGANHPSLVLIGEQPGDHEDREGRPFVGPAGKLLRDALADARIDEDDVYFTNAVKHFNWTRAGKRRLHQKPRLLHINACRPWLEAELQALEPEIIVCLGATAARAVFEKTITISRVRGKILSAPAGWRTLVTAHPSSVLRMPDKKAREAAYRALVADLKLGGLNGRNAKRPDALAG